MTPFDNKLALRQLTEAFAELGSRDTPDTQTVPRLLALGGDHSIALAELRALAGIYGQPIT